MSLSLGFNNTLQNLTLLELVLNIRTKFNSIETSFLLGKQQETQSVIVDHRVIQTIENYSLPSNLKDLLKNVARFIELEIDSWCKKNEKFLRYLLDYKVVIPYLKWTQEGRIDTAKTLDLILGNQELNIYLRLTLSCIYCLKERFLNDWKELSRDNQLIYLHSSLLRDRFDWMRDVQFYFAGETSKISPIISIQHLINAVKACNIPAAQFLWGHLSPQDKYEILNGTIYQVCVKNFMFDFFYQQVAEDAREQFVRINYRVYLELLLDHWLWNDKFFSAMEQVQDHLEDRYLSLLLSLIVRKMLEYPVQEQFSWMLRKFWFDYSEQLLANNFLDLNYQTLFKLIESGDKGSLTMILKDMTVQDKVDLLNTPKLVIKLILKDKCEEFDLVLREVYKTDNKVAEQKTKLAVEYFQCGFQRMHFTVNLEAIKKITNWAAPMNNFVKTYVKNSIICSKYFKFTKELPQEEWNYFLDHLDYLEFTATERCRLRYSIFSERLLLEICFAKLTTTKKIKWEFLDELFNWYCNSDGDQIRDFKQKLLELDFRRLAIYKLLVMKGYKVLDQTLRYLLPGPEQVLQHKTNILNSEHHFPILPKLIPIQKLSSANQLLRDVFSTQEEIVDYKNNLFISKFAYREFSSMLSSIHLDWDTIRVALAWFNPKRESIEHFKSRFNHFSGESQQVFYQLLDEYAA